MFWAHSSEGEGRHGGVSVFNPSLSAIRLCIDNSVLRAVFLPSFFLPSFIPSFLLSFLPSFFLLPSSSFLPSSFRPSEAWFKKVQEGSRRFDREIIYLKLLQ